MKNLSDINLKLVMSDNFGGAKKIFSEPIRFFYFSKQIIGHNQVLMNIREAPKMTQFKLVDS